MGEAMRMLSIALCFAPTLALAEEWKALDGAGVTFALTARVLAYDAGAQQDFFADGRTLYTSDGTNSWGHWRVQGNQYCSNWLPSDRWDCYDLAQLGLKLRFSQNGAPPAIGQYIDLN